MAISETNLGCIQHTVGRHKCVHINVYNYEYTIQHKLLTCRQFDHTPYTPCYRICGRMDGQKEGLMIQLIRQRVPILYNGPPIPLKIAHSRGGSEASSNTWFLGPTRVHIPNGISRGCRARDCDRPTDRQTTLLRL